jgi:hypothetical protein
MRVKPTIKPLLGVLTIIVAPLVAACVPPPPGGGVIRSGMYKVGSEVTPGVYASAADGQPDYAARLDPAQNILSNQFADRVLIQVLPTDTYIEFTGTFSGYQPRPITPPPPTGLRVSGTWVVNAEVAPGTYRVAPVAGGAYWARLADVNGQNIIDNDFQTGQTYVTVDPSDFAVEFEGVLFPG